MIEVTLTQGLVALVDDQDAELIDGRRWRAVQRDARWYAAGRIGGKDVYMHRHLMEVADPAVFVDHVNRNGLDNRRVNLRRATPAQNAANVPAYGGRSSFKGVFPSGRGRWRAQITAQGQRLSLGTFDHEHEAAEAYNAAALQLHGEYAHLNVIPLVLPQLS